MTCQAKPLCHFVPMRRAQTDSTYAAIAAAEPEAEVIQSGFSILPEEMPEARAYLSVWLEGLYTLEAQPLGSGQVQG